MSSEDKLGGVARQGGEGPLRIWGEDAIVSFPGAQESIIDERDAYMARTIRAAAQGAHYISEWAWNMMSRLQKWRFAIPDWRCVLVHCMLLHCPVYEQWRVTYTMHCHW